MKRKNALLVGVYSFESQAILKKLKLNEDINLYGTYSSNEEKEILEKENAKPVNFLEMTKFLEFNNLSKTGLDFIINASHLIKDDINTKDYFNLLTFRYANIHFLDGLIYQLISGHKSTKIINLSSSDVYLEKNTKVEHHELSIHDATDIVGKMRSIGESNYGNCINLRVDVIGKNLYRKQQNLLEQFLDLKEGEDLEINKNKYWNGLTSLEFAAIIENIILKDIKIANVQHVFSNLISVSDIFKYLNKIYNKQLNIIEKDGEISSKILTTINKDIHKKIWGEQRKSLEDALDKLKLFYEN